MKKKINIVIKIPDDIECNIDGKKVIVSGKNGKLEQELDPLIEIQKDDDRLLIFKERAGKKERKIAGTMAAKIKNLIKGIQEGFTYKLKVAYSHFPMRVEFDSVKRIVMIKNFLGERRVREAVVLPNVDIKVHSEVIEIKSIDKEAAGQSAANIEKATKVRRKDIRIFQDGIYIFSKPGR